MKKIIIGIVALLLLVGAVLGIVFGVRACNEKKISSIKNVEVMQIFEDKQEVIKGKPVIYQFYAYSDNQYTSVTYSLNNAEEVSISGATFGEAKNHKEYGGEAAKYYVDTGAQILDTDDMSLGYYLIVFYGHTADGTKVQLNEPYQFKLVVAPAA